MSKVKDDAILPTGVDLRDPEDFAALRTSIFDNTKNSIVNKFPHTYGGMRLEVEDVEYENPKDFDLKQQKDALLKNKFLSWRLRGNLKLYNDDTNELLDSKKLTLMRVPYLTDRGTTIHNGNEYVTLTQARLLPGVYTRKRNTGEVEAHFNPRRGTGHTFRVRLEPETQLYKMAIGQASLRLYSLLHDLGVPDDQLERSWGKEILEANKAAYDSRVFDKAYQRLVKNPDPNASQPEKAKAIREALDMAKFDSSVINRTLPNLLNRKVASEWVVKAAMAQPQQQQPQLGAPNPMLQNAPVADSQDAYIKFEEKRLAEEQKEDEAVKKHRLEMEALMGKMPDGGPDLRAIEKTLVQSQLSLRKAKEKAETDRIKADIKRDTDAKALAIKEEAQRELDMRNNALSRIDELKNQKKQLANEQKVHEKRKRDLEFKMQQKQEAEQRKMEMQAELDQIKMASVKYASTNTANIKILGNGQMVNVDKLYKLLSDIPVEEVAVADIKGYGSRSKRDRFGPARYEKADTEAFGIIDADNNIVDGRHRYFKNVDLGNTIQKFKRALPEHIRQAYVEHEASDYNTSQKQKF